MTEVLYRYLKSCTAATAIEYALIAGGISVAIASIVFLLGDEILSIFTNVGTAMTNTATEAETTR